MIIDDKDRALLELLSANSRESTAELARRMDNSRSTVTSRIERLERMGVITGYTIRFSEKYAEGQIQAAVMIRSNPKHNAIIIRTLRQLPAIRSLHTVNGVYDMVAMASARSTNELDSTLDQIGNIEGVEKTVSSIILSTKFER